MCMLNTRTYLSISTDTETRRKLRLISGITGRSMSQVVQELIERELRDLTKNNKNDNIILPSVK